MVKRADVIIEELTKAAERMKKVRKVAEEEKELLAQQESEPASRNISLTQQTPLVGK